MKNKRKKVLGFLSGIVLTMAIVPAILVSAKSNDKVTIKTFVKELQEVAKTSEPLMKEGEYKAKDFVTWEDAVVLTNRADEIMNGESYNKDLYKQVKEKQRLVGLAGLTSKEMKAARICFVKGIIIGEPMGSYSQERKLYVREKLTRKEVDKLMERLESKTKRIKLTSDGQVTRTTNLPKNYKAYDYILASFPNEFYETDFEFSRRRYGRKQERYEDYAYPKDMKKLKFTNSFNQTFVFKDDLKQYGDLWMEKVEQNLEARLNFDYRTSGNEWISKLRQTYFIAHDAEYDKSETDNIKEYVKIAKKNHVVVQSKKIVVEPSSMYMEGGSYYVRCYVKFKVSADTFYQWDSMKQHELVYSSGDYIFFKNLKKNTWYEGYFDIVIDGYLGYPSDENSVWSDNLFREPGK